MKRTKGFFAALSRERGVESGVATIEYAVMLIVVSVAVSAFGPGLGGAVNSVFSRMTESLEVADSQNDRDENDPERALHEEN